MVKHNAVRGWVFLLVALMFISLVLYELLPIWQFSLLMILLAGGLGGGIYLGVQKRGIDFLRLVGDYMDRVFIGLADMFSGPEESRSRGSSSKNRVPRPTGYWKAQLIEAVGGICELQHCKNHRNLEVHHIHEHSKGGSNDLSNLLVLCTEHHKDCRPGGGIPKTRQRHMSKKPNRFNKPEFVSKWKNSGFGTGQRKRQHYQKPRTGISW